mgnify:CR=1 FL=1
MYRTKTGGLINRKKVLNFSFNGKNLKGFEGDTLSSALLGNGIHLVGCLLYTSDAADDL